MTRTGPDPAVLDDVALDALREMANIAGAAAATELSRVAGADVAITVPRSRVLRRDGVGDTYGDRDLPTTLIAIGLGGDDLQIVAAVLLTPDHVARLQTSSAFADADTLLATVGGRMSSAFARVIGDLARSPLSGTVTGIATGPSGAALDSLVTTIHGRDDRVLVIDIDLTLDTHRVDARLLFLPDPGTIERLLARLGARASASR